MATRYKTSMQDVYRDAYKALNETISSGFESVSKAFATAGLQKRQLRSDKVGEIEKMFPGISWDEQFRDWQNDTVVYEKLISHGEGLVSSYNAGKMFFNGGSYLSGEAVDAMHFGIDTTSQITQKDFADLNAFVTGEGVTAETMGIVGLINKTNNFDLSSDKNIPFLEPFEEAELKEKGILQDDEDWEEIRHNKTLILGRLSAFERGFKENKPDMFYDEGELLNLRNSLMQDADNTRRLIQSDSSYLENAQRVINWNDKGALRTILEVEKNPNNPHGGFQYHRTMPDGSRKLVKTNEHVGETDTLLIQSSNEQWMRENDPEMYFLMNSTIEEVVEKLEVSNEFHIKVRDSYPIIYDKVARYAESYMTKKRMDRRAEPLIVDHLEMQKNYERHDMINLTLASTMNEWISGTLNVLESDTSKWRSNFSDETQFWSQNEMLDLYDKVRMLNNDISEDENNLRYNKETRDWVNSLGEEGLVKMLEELFYNRAEFEGKMAVIQ